MNPQYVTVVLPIPHNQSAIEALFAFFLGMQYTITDPESKVLFLEFSCILGDFLPEEMAEQIRDGVAEGVDSRLDGLQAIASQMVDRITHLPPDEPAKPGQPRG
jgi:hypothetical protein